MKKGYLFFLFALFAIPIFLQDIHAEDFPGTDITVQITDTIPKSYNSRIAISTENGVPLPDTVIYMKQQDAELYMPIGKTDRSGICKLYLIPNHKEQLLLQHLGFDEKRVSLIYQGKNDEQNFAITMHRNGEFQNIQFKRIAIISANRIYAGVEARFHILNTGMENIDPMAGDVRYRPVQWGIKKGRNEKDRIQQVSLSNQQPLITMVIKKAGLYSLSIHFQKEIFKDNQWTSDGSLVLKEKVFQVIDKNIVPSAVATFDSGLRKHWTITVLFSILVMLKIHSSKKRHREKGRER